MKFLSVRDLRSKSTRRSRVLAAVSELQRRSVERGTDAIIQAEIDAEILAVRRARRQHGSPSQ